VAIHCKAGKGRTGLVICCYLLFSRYCKSAYESLVFYGKVRTKDEKGVTIPSQIRYVYYFDHFLKWREKSTVKYNCPPRTVLKIFKIRVITIPNLLKGGFFPNFNVSCKGFIFYDYNKSEKERNDKFLRGVSYHDFMIREELLVYDDVKITFFNQGKKAFQFWFNTWFIEDTGILYINKDMIDGSDKDKRNTKYDKNFSIKVFMSHIPDYEMKPQYMKVDKQRPGKKKWKTARQLEEGDDSETMSEGEVESMIIDQG
jgi:phosphatidylinositol-3,4,5-trisphosphate 3-phosphatase and dual-specificity protein phosphatase PTEN